MLVQKKLGPIKKMILVSIIIIIFAVIVYLLYNSFIADSSDKRKIPVVDLSVDVLELPHIDTQIDADFLTKPPYTNLVQYGELPVVVERVGRNNPFRELPFALIETE